MKLSLAILICAAHAAMASKKGLRGVPASSSNLTARGLKKNNCSQEQMKLQPATQCPMGQAAMFSFRECAWTCKVLPEKTEPEMYELEERQAAPPTTPTTNTGGSKGGKGGKGGSLCQADPNRNPMVECPAGYSVMFNHKACEYQCNKNPAMTATAPQSRQAAPSSPTPRNVVSGASKLCQADPVRNPMVPCPAGYSVMFNHKDCDWQCKLLPETKAPVESHQPTCPPEQVLFFDIFDGTFECIDTEDTQCPKEEHLVFDQEQDFFYCGEI